MFRVYSNHKWSILCNLVRPIMELRSDSQYAGCGGKICFRIAADYRIMWPVGPLCWSAQSVKFLLCAVC